MSGRVQNAASGANLLGRGLALQSGLTRGIRAAVARVLRSNKLPSSRDHSPDRFGAGVLAAIIAAGTDCVNVLDLQGKVVFMCPNGCEQMEVDCNLYEGHDWASLWPEGARPRALRALELARSGIADRFQLERASNNGQSKWWEVAVTPAAGPDGGVAHVVSVSRDITELKAAEKAREQSEATLSAVLEAMPAGIAVADADGRIVRENAAHREVWGLGAEERAQDFRATDVPAGFWPDSGRRLTADEWALSRAVRLGVVTRGQLIECRTAEGSESRAVLSGAAPIRDDHHRRLGAVVTALDVTHSHRAEQKLKRSERQLRSTLESTTDAVFTLSPDWRFAYLNRQAAEQIGGGRDLRGKGVWDAFPDLRETAFGKAYQRCMEQRVPTEAEEHFAPLGRAVSVRAFPAEDGGLTVFFRDVTESRLAADRLAKSEARFQAMANNIPQLAWMAQPDGGIFWFNRRWFEYTGTNLEQVQGWGWRKLQHPDHGHRVLAGLEKAWRTGERWEDTFPLRRHDGSFRWFLSRAEPIRDDDGDIVLWFGTNTDVTERLEAERALRDSENRVRLATDAGEVGIFDWDIATGSLESDARAKAFLSLPPDAPVTPEVFRATLHDEDRPSVRRAITAAMDPVGSGEFAAEYRVTGTGDNVGRIVKARGRVTFVDGKPSRMVGTVADVTLQRQAEAVLARDKSELEALVAERTRDLEETQARLAHSQRMEALGQLAGGIAHDFNNVLQAVQGGASLLARHPEDPKAVRRLSTLVSDAAARGATITGRLLAFSRRGELKAEAVDAAALMEGMSQILKHTLGAAIQVSVRAEPGAPNLLADPRQLETVLINLATNARDAMPAGGRLALGVSLDTVVSESGLLKPGRYARISVSDDGMGIPPELLARVTEPFFTTKPVGQGTGLGLAMAKGFAEQSGGALALQSAFGEGTTVTMWLPAAEDAVSGPCVEPSRATSFVGRGRILVVEDDELVREVTCEELEGVGFQVLAAECGATALAHLDDGERVDLIISDLSMPGMDGIATIREAQSRCPGLAAILLTGFASNVAELAVDGALSGSFSLLRKPIGLRQLVERIEVLMHVETSTAS